MRHFCMYKLHLPSQHAALVEWVGCMVQAGNTPLHMASDQGHLDVVSALLGAGARCDAVNSVSVHIVRAWAHDGLGAAA